MMVNHLAAASAKELQNMVYNKVFMCPASPQNAVEVLPEVGVEDFTDLGLCQALPTHR